MIKFPNDECYDLSNQSGTCYTPLQCKAYGGTGTASCANGYGQCCISKCVDFIDEITDWTFEQKSNFLFLKNFSISRKVSRSCHNTTSQKVVYFKNPSYPQVNCDRN